MELEVLHASAGAQCGVSSCHDVLSCKDLRYVWMFCMRPPSSIYSAFFVPCLPRACPLFRMLVVAGKNFKLPTAGLPTTTTLPPS
jgi:hypothetical protein